jgi:hypothetical protein
MASVEVVFDFFFFALKRWLIVANLRCQSRRACLQVGPEGFEAVRDGTGELAAAEGRPVPSTEGH